MAFQPIPLHELLLLSLFNNEYVVSKILNETRPQKIHAFMPVTRLFQRMFDLTGYQHQHNTRPDCVRNVLESSPVALIAWIYDKYVEWSDQKWCKFSEQQQDTYCSPKGTNNLTNQLVWDDVITTACLYFLNHRVRSGIDYYHKNLGMAYGHFLRTKTPSTIFFAISEFEKDPFAAVNVHKYLSHLYTNLVYYRPHPFGGHFPGFEHPRVLAKDIADFLTIIDV
ncbi:hypothetical protein RFI_16295 [Reticulomyxa filosa]|uniref:Epoxide hydrolase n=1 Tax=Reticulomyxa filosa TaxID=46433 RepID=X6N6J7_RETFI|nr:hypothetical protein RFI_16295 [Reticulomyxa filosa]|eukprot:ETO20912.1 hypothetical protein RFI_16295 [Reticulomyxa filosa]